MSHIIRVPMEVLEKLQELVGMLESSISPYRPEFLARMYRARASDIEGKGKTLGAVKRKFSS